MSAVDISILGDRILEKKLSKLLPRVQKKVVRQALRKGAVRAKKRITQNIKDKGLIATGNMLNAFEKTKIRSQSKNPRKLIRIGPQLPSREDLNIAPDDKYYYPMVIESETPFIKPAIDDNKAAEIRKLSRDIGSGIKREARK